MPRRQGLDRGNSDVTPQLTWSWCVCHVHCAPNQSLSHVLLDMRLAQLYISPLHTLILKNVFCQN